MTESNINTLKSNNLGLSNVYDQFFDIFKQFLDTKDLTIQQNIDDLVVALGEYESCFIKFYNNYQELTTKLDGVAKNHTLSQNVADNHIATTTTTTTISSSSNGGGGGGLYSPEWYQETKQCQDILVNVCDQLKENKQNVANKIQAAIEYLESHIIITPTNATSSIGNVEEKGNEFDEDPVELWNNAKSSIREFAALYSIMALWLVLKTSNHLHDVIGDTRQTKPFEAISNQVFRKRDNFWSLVGWVENLVESFKHSLIVENRRDGVHLQCAQLTDNNNNNSNNTVNSGNNHNQGYNNDGCGVLDVENISFKEWDTISQRSQFSSSYMEEKLKEVLMLLKCGIKDTPHVLSETNSSGDSEIIYDYWISTTTTTAENSTLVLESEIH